MREVLFLNDDIQSKILIQDEMTNLFQIIVFGWCKNIIFAIHCIEFGNKPQNKPTGTWLYHFHAHDSVINHI